MRIDRMALQDFPPIKSLLVETRSNVVIIAGANGSGKTRLKEAIVNSFRKPTRPQASLIISATRKEEEEAWASRSLEVDAGRPCQKLQDYLLTRSRAQTYLGTIVQIDSNRSVQPVRFEAFTLATEDPDDMDVNYSWYLSPFSDRWQQLVNKIYKKAANRDQKIAKFVKADPSKTGADAIAAYPDPFIPYQEVFGQLLPGKILEPIDPKVPREFHYRSGDSKPMPLDTLSSGEQEVIKVAFDLVWKRLTHSIVLVDEPELHLHPTLTFRLVETLKALGGGTNQFILFTHSADLISTYYSTGSVYFIDSSASDSNQAHQFSDLSKDHATVLRAAGANLGLFAVGKRLVFIEGREASVDRLVYHKVAQVVFPDSYLMPIGSVDNIVSLKAVVDELTSMIFGIDLFLIRDRDGLSDDMIAKLETNARFRSLRRRHIENYLLDADVLSSVAQAFYLDESKSDVQQIRAALRDIAGRCLMQSILWNVREHLGVLASFPQPSLRSVDRLTTEELAKGLSAEISGFIDAIGKSLEPSEIDKLVNREHAKLQSALSSEDWVMTMPGKLIFAKFCGEFFRTEPVRVREAYADIAIRDKPEVFQDIADILKGFSAIATRSQ